MAKSQEEKAREAAEAAGEPVTPAGEGAQPSAQKDGEKPVTREQEAATEAVSPQELKVEGGGSEIHDALTALEQAWAAVPLVESERRPDLANLDLVSEKLDDARDAVKAERTRLKKENA